MPDNQIKKYGSDDVALKDLEWEMPSCKALRGTQEQVDEYLEADRAFVEDEDETKMVALYEKYGMKWRYL